MLSRRMSTASRPRGRHSGYGEVACRGAGAWGIGIPGFTLVTSAVSTIETPLLAICILMWWSLRRSPFSIGCGRRYGTFVTDWGTQDQPACVRSINHGPVGHDSIMESDEPMKMKVKNTLPDAYIRQRLFCGRYRVMPLVLLVARQPHHGRGCHLLRPRSS